MHRDKENNYVWAILTTGSQWKSHAIFAVVWNNRVYYIILVLLLFLLFFTLDMFYEDLKHCFCAENTDGYRAVLLLDRNLHISVLIAIFVFFSKENKKCQQKRKKFAITWLNNTNAFHWNCLNHFFPKILFRIFVVFEFCGNFPMWMWCRHFFGDLTD